MAFRRRTVAGNAWTEPLTTMKRRGAGGGAWADIQNVYRRSLDNQSWVLVWSAFKVVTGSINPGTANGSASGKATFGNVSSNTVTATGANGNGGPYTYRWRVDNASQAITIGSSTNASTLFLATRVNEGMAATGYGVCTISDGQSSVDVSVPITLSYVSTA